MKAATRKSNTIRVVNIMIIAMVVAGAAVFVVLNQATSERELMPTLFLAFLGAIITVQVIPGIVLLGSILRGVFSFSRKPVPSEASDSTSTHK